METTGKIAGKITNKLSFIVFLMMIVACNTDHGMMHESGPNAMTDWNWSPILICVGLGVLVGVGIWLLVIRRNR